MSRRLLALRNVLKVWLLLAALSLVAGLVGWAFGGYRVAVLFAASVVLLASAIYAYADRIVMGMLGAREMVRGEAPAGSHSPSGSWASPRRRSSRGSSRTSSRTSAIGTSSCRPWR